MLVVKMWKPQKAFSGHKSSFDSLFFPPPPVHVCLTNELSDRYADGERGLPQEATQVMPPAAPPRCVILLPDRRPRRPGALHPLPQRRHQEKLHPVTTTPKTRQVQEL